MISEKILIIDDDIRVIKSLKLILNKYELVEFTNGYEAIEFLKKPRDISLVLLDVMMPEVDGLSVLKEIKKIKGDLAVIMMTAYGSKDIAVEALRYRADDFVEKPFDPSEISEKINKILQERFLLNKNASFKDYRIDKIKSFIKRNFTNASLPFIAEEMCLSPKYLSRMFKDQTGNSFRNYLLEVKMEEGKSLLKNTALSIDEIAYKLGYQNPESFMRLFKKLESFTPTEYRRKEKL